MSRMSKGQSWHRALVGPSVHLEAATSECAGGVWEVSITVLSELCPYAAF